jgi:4-amino-4-deoxy-L-arabinose transferase-like glycosyltransferase
MSVVIFLTFLAQHAVALVLLLIVAAAAGTFLAGRSESIGLRLAFGLALLGQLFVLLGIAGLLRPWAFVVIALVCVVGGAARSGFAWWKTIRWPWLAIVPIAVLPFFLLAMFPPIAFDETLYHLPFVQALARFGKIEFWSNLRFPAFPQLHELLGVPLFLALGDTATHLVALAAAIILAVLLLHSSRGENRTTGILAASLCLGHPIVVQLGTVNHVELSLMLFITAGAVCLDRMSDPTNPQSSIPNPQSRYAAAAGFFLGTACCAKYLGWYFAVAGFAFLLFFGSARKRTVPIFLGALALAVLPMYGEIVRFTRNPVHPFAGTIFGATPWALPPAYAPHSRLTTGLRLFWDVTFARERLNQQPHYSPLFAFAFLITLAAAMRNRRAAFVAATCVGYIVIFTFLPRDSRYLLPLLPLLSIVAARSLTSWLQAQPRAHAIAALFSLVAIAPAFAYAGYRLVKQGLPPMSPAQFWTLRYCPPPRTIYLEQRIPEYRALLKRGPGITYLCGAEQLQGFGGSMLGDLNGLTPMQKIIGESRDAAELARSLQRIGARDFLVSRARCPAPWQSLPREPHFQLIYEDEGAALWRVQPVSVSPGPTVDNAR